ncbi:RNA polymerase sigma factor [Novosphingobium profundi]|uniref:RNA polymerase sigma factor n=1 Tax=Novosphingobium profundi TaxID=1774954 RepID=UPI001BDAB9CB|nr:RNA polymerase sigma factor [Novosphingobium profundi]MBT0669282.1 RNA polymerase sigma factor [Novosphingobium profundi]
MEQLCDTHGQEERAIAPVDWEATQRALLRYLLARRLSPDLAEDIAQETLARILVVARSQAISSVYALAFRIASNLLVDHVRLETRKAPPPDEDFVCDAPSLDRILDSQRAFDVFQRCLSRMPHLRREVLLRRRVHHESCRKIGEDLTLSSKAVEKHITRALCDLRRAMNREGIDLTGWNG